MSAPTSATADLPSLREEDSSPIRTFEGRLPDPIELLRWGGSPGLVYAFISGTNLSKYRRLGWSIAPGLDGSLLEVRGPKGTCDLFVLYKGKPLPGADPANGIRAWVLDPAILEQTGLERPYPNTAAAAAQPERPAGGKGFKPLPKPALHNTGA